MILKNVTFSLPPSINSEYIVALDKKLYVFSFQYPPPHSGHTHMATSSYFIFFQPVSAHSVLKALQGYRF